ncbi:hypothetical protein CMI37_38520 [Candidatus Pacearchaeota archaeon]|nr:hypothetical protein [Candidatus Pacearchaeota archaeon]|tara:strand:+ start:255 stop:461 length:207 start_codon:yes stop_codon:yes gene_type:complete
MKKLMTIESPEDWPGTRTVRDIYEAYGDEDQKEYWVSRREYGGIDGTGVEWKYDFKTFKAARSWAAWE